MFEPKTILVPIGFYEPSLQRVTRQRPEGLGERFPNAQPT